jgi:predicted MFS family arabinose efflux permease
MQLRLLILAALVGMTAQLFRTAHVVVAPDIMRELGASAGSLAALTSAMFLGAAVFQIPSGMLIDRFGARAMLAAMLVASGIGAGLFAAAQTVGGLVFARAFMGVGGAALVMAGIILCARWFDMRHFSSVAGGLMGASQLGNLGATVPMALAASAFGWRGAFWALLVGTCVLGAVVYILGRDAPEGHDFHTRPRETFASSVAGVREVLRVPGIWRLMAMAWVAWGSMSCIVSLWAGPYLSDRYGLDTLARGKALFWLAVGIMTGVVAFTLIDRWLNATRRTIAAGAAVNALLFAVLAVTPSPGLTGAIVLFASIAFIGGFSGLIAAHGRKFYPDRLIGRGISTVNCAVLFGAASLQAGTGMLIGWLSTPGQPIPDHAYRAMFGAMSAVLVIALACYWRCPEARAPAPARHPGA